MEYIDFFRNKNILITGGLGFIGSTLAIKLAETGANITVVDSLIPDYGGNIFNIEPVKDKININVSDVRDQNSMDYLIQDQDYLFNLAGTLSHIDSMKDPFTDLEINCVSQLRILESCRKNNPDIKIVFAGTRGQYGKCSYNPVDEKHPLIPIDVNGINNIAGEQYHILYNNVYGIKACSLRLTNTYGPRHQMKHHRQGVLNWFIRQVMDNTTIKIYGSGSQIRDTSYVDDVVDAFLLAMMHKETSGEVYNIGGEAFSLIDFVEKLIEINGKGNYELIEYPDESKAIEIGDYIADYSKFSKLTGWQPKINLEEGLQKTLAYYKQHRSMYW
jgi:nucleoside-diphosphate-sugar epimerase